MSMKRMRAGVYFVSSTAALLLCCILAVLVVLESSFARAEEEPGTVVSGILDEDQLRSAIQNANDGDILEIEGNFSLAQGTGLTVDREITIRSAGDAPHTILQTSPRIRHFLVSSDATLTLQNIILDGSEIGGGVKLSGNGLLILGRGAVIQNGLANYGGGVEISSSSKCTMDDGAVIQNCQADYYGGGVFMASANGTLIMNEGAVIQGCRSVYDGGGVFVYGAFTMNGGTIANNQSARGGGLAGSLTAPIVMYGGSIAENSSEEMGGGFMAHDRCSLTMYGGEIAENRSAQGGGITLSGSGALFTMRDGVIRGNTATGDGPDREGFGGGLYVVQGDAEIYRGKIINNQATHAGHAHGGGVYLNSKTNLTLYSAVITDNAASFQGGGVWICNTGSGSANNFRGTAVYGNETEGSGKDLHLNSQQTVFSLSPMALGFGEIRWKNEPANAYLNQLAGLTGVLDLTSEISEGDIQRAQQYGAVFITGNRSAYRGGGLAINGLVTFGGPAPEHLDLELQKQWEGDPPAAHPDAVKVYLVANGIKQDDQAITLRASNGYQGSFENLPFQDADGNIIVYAVAEQALPDYTAGYSWPIINDDGNYEITITNTYAPEKVNVPVWKAWDDEGNRRGKRPDSVTVQLYADGEACGEPAVLRRSNSWSCLWKDLPKYSGAAEIAYTVKETKIGDAEVAEEQAGRYAVSYRTDDETGMVTILNTYVPEKTDVAVGKAWEDFDDRYGKRPDSVTVQLYADGEAHGEPIELHEGNRWGHVWEQLLKHRSDGDTEILYTAKETKVGNDEVTEEKGGGYAASYETDPEDGTITITNTLITAALVLRKVDAHDSAKGLPGAKFVLYAHPSAEHTHSEYATEEPACCWTEFDTQSSGEDGLLVFQGLDNGEYMLAETEAPEGYQRPAGQWQIKIAGSEIESIHAVGRALAVAAMQGAEEGSVEYLLPNEKNYMLPMTGGTGLWLITFTGLGCIAAGIAAWLFMLKKKRRPNRLGKTHFGKERPSL